MKRFILYIIGACMLAGCGSSKFVGEGQTFAASQVNVRKEFFFKDHNTMTLERARQIGVEPIGNRAEAARKVHRLTLIEDSRYYKLDPMTHSIPYLAKGATKLLKTVGKRFQKRLKHDGYRPHRIIATSMLRTRDDVERLRKVNGNAAKNSAHLYATTFDLSYTRFNRIDIKGSPVNNETMANLLGEVLYDLRAEGRCRVIFERNQHCFHIMSER